MKTWILWLIVATLMGLLAAETSVLLEIQKLYPQLSEEDVNKILNINHVNKRQVITPSEKKRWHEAHALNDEIEKRILQKVPTNVCILRFTNCVQSHERRRSGIPNFGDQQMEGRSTTPTTPVFQSTIEDRNHGKENRNYRDSVGSSSTSDETSPSSKPQRFHRGSAARSDNKKGTVKTETKPTTATAITLSNLNKMQDLKSLLLEEFIPDLLNDMTVDNFSGIEKPIKIKRRH
ncbi:uncharacterized protein LOC116800959 isoform X5 [Drosophila sechellia]|nr:uncharacterized protein LOC116800959 isoform X5 [Drosophila sechellia]